MEIIKEYRLMELLRKFARLRIRTFLIFIVSLLFFSSCKKDKIETNIDNQEEQAKPEDLVPGPSQSGFIKIRLINAMEPVDKTVEYKDDNTGSVLFSAEVEDLVGKVTLTYADGTPVSTQTSQVEGESDYIEIPYGTYQFRVLTEDGRQISSAAFSVDGNSIDNSLSNFDPPTSRMLDGSDPFTVSSVTYAPVTTYQPGGVYTIRVEPQSFSYFISLTGEYGVGKQNQFRIIRDNPENMNQEMGRVQAINTLLDRPVLFKLNGQDMGDLKGVNEATDYTIVGDGMAKIAAYDEDGTLLVEKEFDMAPNQNLSCWLWEKETGELELLMVYNDLSSVYYADKDEEYGQDNRLIVPLNTSIRFLNLCPDEPYVSFTLDNGLDPRKSPMAMPGSYQKAADEAIYNLEPGKPASSFPYTRWVSNKNEEFQFIVFRSTPTLIPGSWMSEVFGLSSVNTVANSSLYTDALRSIPTVEAGIYTVALIGRTGEHANGRNNAKLVIFKHNK